MTIYSQVGWYHWIQKITLVNYDLCRVYRAIDTHYHNGVLFKSYQNATFKWALHVYKVKLDIPFIQVN